MTNKLHTCIWFDGTAQAAAAAYCALIPGSKILHDNGMVVTFELNGRKIMGLNGGPLFQVNPSISFTLVCNTVAATNAAWDALAEGGSVLIGIDKYPWSERYGWLKDKFGVTWQITVGPDDHSVTPSMLFVGERFGQAADAIALYSSLFQNASTQVMVKYPEGDPSAGKVMYSSFSLDGHPLIAMDGPGQHAYSFNEAVSFVVECKDQEEIDFFWNKLTEEGAESQCGWLKDKFGVSWQIIPADLGKWTSDPERAPRVMAALMKMKKLDIATLASA